MDEADCEPMPSDQAPSLLRQLILDGAAGPVVERADERYFASLRDRIRSRSAAARPSAGESPDSETS